MVGVGVGTGAEGGVGREKWEGLRGEGGIAMGEGAEKGRGEGAALVDAGGGRKSGWEVKPEAKEVRSILSRCDREKGGKGREVGAKLERRLTFEHRSDDPRNLLDRIVLSVADLRTEKYEPLASSSNRVLKSDPSRLVVLVSSFSSEDCLRTSRTQPQSAPFTGLKP